MPIDDRADIDAVERRDGSFSPFADRPSFGETGKPQKTVLQWDAYKDLAQDDSEEEGIWGALKWLDAPDNAKRSLVVAALGGESDLLGAASRGFSYARYTSPVDVLNAFAEKYDPEAYLGWKKRQQQRLLQIEKYGTEIMTDPEGAVSSASNPYGRSGEIAALAFDIVLSPWNLIPAGVVGKGAEKVAVRLGARRLAEIQTSDEIGFAVTQMLDATSGSKNLAGKGHSFSVGITKALEERVAQASNFAVSEAEARARVSAFLDDLPTIDREVSRAKARIQAGKMAPEDEIERIGLTLDEATKMSDEIVAAMKELTPDDALRASLLRVRERFPDDVVAAADEVMRVRDGIVDGTGPLSRAAEGMLEGGKKARFAEAGVSAFNQQVDEAVKLVDEVLSVSAAATGRQVLLPSQLDFFTYTAAKSESRLFTRPERVGAGVEAALEPGGAKPELMKRITEHMRAQGLPEEFVSRVAPEWRDGVEAAEQAMALMQDRRNYFKAKTKMTAAELREYSRDAMALNYETSAIIRQLQTKVDIHRSGLKVRRGGKVEKTGFGKGFLAQGEKGDVKEVMKALSELKAAHAQWVTDAGGDIMTKLRTLTTRGLIDPQAWAMQPGLTGAPFRLLGAGLQAGAEGRLGGAGKAVSRMLTEGRGTTPVFTSWGLRSPLVVFKGTGAYEAIAGPAGTFTEALGHYAKEIETIFRGMDVEGRRLVAELADGATKADDVLRGGRQDVIDAEKRLREVFDEIADLVGLPKDRRLSNYFPHVADKSPAMLRAFENGHLPPELASSEGTIGWLLRRQDVGKEWTSRFMKKREGTLSEIRGDAREVAMIYASSALKAHYLSPAFKEAGDLILGAAIETGKREGKLMGPKAAFMARNDPRASARLGGIPDSAPTEYKKMMSFLNDLENQVHGIPTRLANDMHDKLEELYDLLPNKLRAKAGLPKRSVLDDAALSSAITTNIYRSMIGLSPMTAAINLTQPILAASEYGALSALKPLAMMFARHDPVEVALAGGVRTGKSHKALKSLAKEEQSRLFRDFEELHDLRRKVGSARRLEDTSGGKALISTMGRDKAEAVSDGISRFTQMYDKVLFAPMEWTERFNRGISFHIGMSRASKEGMGLFDAIRYGQMVSDETNFIFGMLGRGPAFHNPYLRPMIAPFMSFPAGMVGATSRMFRENPTALLRYMGNFGALSSAVMKLGLDPGRQLMPFGFLPARFMFTNGVTPMARVLMSSWKYATAEDEIQRQEAGVDFIEAQAMLWLPFPWRTAKTGFNVSQYMGWPSDENKGQIQSQRNFWRALPFVGDTLLSTQNPVFITAPDDFPQAMSGAYYATAKLLGFAPLAEAAARRGVDRARELQREREKIRKELVSDVIDAGSPWELDDEDYEKMLAFAEKYGFDQIDAIVESAQNATVPLLNKSLDRLDEVSRRQFAGELAEMAKRHPDDLDSILNIRDADQKIRGTLAAGGINY